jgi:thymidylate synthase (FAD)
MKLIRPYYQILSKIDGSEILRSIERAGRTCYKSEDLITYKSAEKFIEMLVSRGHESVLEHEKLSILFVCDRGVSHELVRHRIASFSQESTRYCNYSKDKFDNQLTFIIPKWLRFKEGSYERSFTMVLEEAIWFNSCLDSERRYNKLITGGWQPQEARSILPTSLKTEIVVTANIREWRTIFKQRTAKAAHPQMRELMCPLLDELKTIVPVLFNDINY